MKPLNELGWSQDNIAYVVGCTRPAIKKYLETGEGLTLEQREKYFVLSDLQRTYKAFEREAVGRHAFEIVWKPSYRILAERKSLDSKTDSV